MTDNTELQARKIRAAAEALSEALGIRVGPSEWLEEARMVVEAVDAAQEPREESGGAI